MFIVQLVFTCYFFRGSQRRCFDRQRSTHKNTKLKSIRFRLGTRLSQSAHYDRHTGATKVLQGFWDTL